MKNLTRVFVDTAPTRERLKFGQNDNVVLRSVTNDERRNKDGLKIKKLCYMRFSAIDVDTKKVLAEYVFDHFVADKKEFAVINILHMYNQLKFIMSAVVPKDESAEVKDSFDLVLDDKYMGVIEKGLTSKKDNLSSDEMTLLLSLQREIAESFETLISPYTGVSGELVKLLVVTDKTGGFLELPKEENNTIAKMSRKRDLTISPFYKKRFRNKDRKDSAVVSGDIASTGGNVDMTAMLGGAVSYEESQGLEGI